MEKILIINNGYPSKQNPKYASYMGSINNCLKKAGFVTEVLSLDVDLASKNKVGKLLSYVLFYIRLIFYRKYRNYDWVYLHHYTFYAPFIALSFYKMNNIAVHWHGQEIYTGRKVLISIKQYFYGFLENRNVLHIVPSLFYGQELKRIIDFKQKPKIVVSPSGGVNIDLFNKKIRYEENRREVNIGFASGMTYMKGVDFVIKLIEAFPVIEQEYDITLKFNCIFYGKERLDYKLDIEKYCGNRLKWWNPMPHTDMPQFYNANNILVFPTRADSLGLVALEAMSCGLPVVGPDAFALKEFIVSRKTGEKYKKNGVYEQEIDDFIKSFNDCLINLEKYNPRKSIVEKYSQKAVIEQYKILFKE